MPYPRVVKIFLVPARLPAIAMCRLAGSAAPTGLRAVESRKAAPGLLRKFARHFNVQGLAGGDKAVRTVFMGMIGLILWLVAQAMGLLIAGAGHGWGGAFLFSLPLAILYPLALIRSVSSERRSPATDVAVVAAAIILDLLLLGSMFSSGDGYFMKVWSLDPAFVSAWIAVWAGWQPLFLAMLLRRSLFAGWAGSS